MRTEPDDELAARRARWLAALAQALAEAQRLSVRLLRLQPDSDEAARLRRHIRAVSSEVEALRRAAGLAPSRTVDETLWAKREPARPAAAASND